MQSETKQKAIEQTEPVALILLSNGLLYWGHMLTMTLRATCSMAALLQGDFSTHPQIDLAQQLGAQRFFPLTQSN